MVRVGRPWPCACLAFAEGFFCCFEINSVDLFLSLVGSDECRNLRSLASPFPILRVASVKT